MKSGPIPRTDPVPSVIYLGYDVRPFDHSVAELKREYRSIESDLDRLFSKIRKNPETAAHATPLPGREGKIWQYRCNSSDLRRGSNGGFYVLCFLGQLKRSKLLVPIIVYSKTEGTHQRDGDRIRSLVRWASSFLIDSDGL